MVAPRGGPARAPAPAAPLRERIRSAADLYRGPVGGPVRPRSAGSYRSPSAVETSLTKDDLQRILWRKAPAQALWSFHRMFECFGGGRSGCQLRIRDWRRGIPRFAGQSSQQRCLRPPPRTRLPARGLGQTARGVPPSGGIARRLGQTAGGVPGSGRTPRCCRTPCRRRS